MAPRINIVVALASNGVIGRDGGLPWHLSGDLRRFRDITWGHPIVMGRRTHESIGRLLPGRASIIVTRNADYGVEGATVVDSLDAALTAAAPQRRLFVIGGGEIYALALPQAQVIHLTEVDTQPDGDAFFPALDPAQWREVSSETVRSPPAPDCRFVRLERTSLP